ncbi:zinc finger CCHC domain-containing protein 8-like [Heterocephalus glaber]|uniref:Zinc finger CCHC domain-containing protein 8-like n=1 Tax=Heterocephalus glaber TaxID=10181 RepID=A0AAX6SPX0_HETGA|nr:zinc finger CCHC domain-containing protein 8-like [Heterocephalus glaber]
MNSSSKRSSSQYSLVVQRHRRKKARPCTCGQAFNWEELNLPVPEEKTPQESTVEESEAPDPCTKSAKVERPLLESAPEPTLVSEREEEDSEGLLPGNGSVVSNCDIKNRGSQKLLRGDTSPSTATKIHRPIPDVTEPASRIVPLEFTVRKGQNLAKELSPKPAGRQKGF